MESSEDKSKRSLSVSHREAKETFFKSINSVERLHAKLHETIGKVLSASAHRKVSSVQGLLMYSLGDKELPIGDLMVREFYLGTNVTYNLKKLVKTGYILSRPLPTDKRVTMVRLSPKGKKVQALLDDFFNEDIQRILETCPLTFPDIQTSLKVTETWNNYWGYQFKI